MTQKTLKDRLESIVNELDSLESVELSAIVSKQGLLMAGGHKRNSTINTLAALTATLHMSAESTTMRMSNETPKSIVVETENKYLITCDAGTDALVVALTENDQYLGTIIPKIKKAAEKVKQER